MSSSARNSLIPKFSELNDLISEKCGGKIVFATDDWFAAAECLLNPDPPVWKEGVFTEFGKWMDGWETRRKRTPGHDWCIIQLGLPGAIRGIEADTRYFTGNFAPRISVQAARLTAKDLARMENLERDPSMGKKATDEELKQIATYRSEDWVTLVPMSNLAPGNADTSRSFFSIPVTPISRKRFTHIRLNLFPDGGIARLRVFGMALPEMSRLPSYNLDLFKGVSGFHANEKEDNALFADGGELVDLVAMENGGICLGYSDAHYGHPRNMISSGRGVNMGDGWETARRLDRPPILTVAAGSTGDDQVLEIPGFEWCAFKLGVRGTVEIVEVDTNHFKGNYADSVMIEGAMVPGDWNEVLDDLPWQTLLPAQKLRGHDRHFYKGRELQCHSQISHCRVIMRPDGGISRIRLFGRKADDILEGGRGGRGEV